MRTFAVVGRTPQPDSVPGMTVNHFHKIGKLIADVLASGRRGEVVRIGQPEFDAVSI